MALDVTLGGVTFDVRCSSVLPNVGVRQKTLYLINLAHGGPVQGNRT